jgi:hypothetical protein
MFVSWRRVGTVWGAMWQPPFQLAILILKFRDAIGARVARRESFKLR